MVVISWSADNVQTCFANRAYGVPFFAILEMNSDTSVTVRLFFNTINHIFTVNEKKNAGSLQIYVTWNVGGGRTNCRMKSFLKQISNVFHVLPLKKRDENPVKLGKNPVEPTNVSVCLRWPLFFFCFFFTKIRATGSLWGSSFFFF